MGKEEDTIAAVATPLGRGGLGIIRVSGGVSLSTAERIFISARKDFRGFKPYRLHHGHIVNSSGGIVDEVTAVYMPAPGSFTGEDVLEIGAHGGPVVLRMILEEIYACGVRPALGGEFTRRAFLNGRLDLTQAEAVMEMISAKSSSAVLLAGNKLKGALGERIRECRAVLEALREKLCVAVDFPEDEVECLSPEEFSSDLLAVHERLNMLYRNYLRMRLFREGATVVLSGLVNAGKSSLLNALLGRERAIVTPLPGTTRDYIEEGIDLNGLPVKLVDTAGLRDAPDPVERIGVERGADLARNADLVLIVHDASTAWEEEELAFISGLSPDRAVIVLNKCDRIVSALVDSGPSGVFERVFTSALNGEGIESLVEKIRGKLVGGDFEPGADDLSPNLRQAGAIMKALQEIERLKTDLAAGVPYDLLGVVLEGVCVTLSEITGEITPEDILESVFSSFCIGK